MNTVYRLQFFDLSLHADAIKPVVQGMFLVGFEDGGLLLLVETQKLHDHPFAFGDLFQFLTVGIEEVKVVVAVFLTLHDESGIIPRQKLNGMQGFYIFVASLTV